MAQKSARKRIRNRAVPPPSQRDFPDDFVWGAASCPACCEGETVSDWAKLAAKDGSVPDDGPRHWRRYRYDFKAMADMGVSAYRFGCDWGRLQRAPYAPLVRDDALRYLEMMAELRGLGIEPWLTLFHNALPRWASKVGGWLNPETPDWFADFAGKLAAATDGEVGHWLTLHEPQVYALSCYVWDTFPGGGWGRLDQARLAMKRMQEGHRLAARVIRKRLPGAKIGISLPGGDFIPRQAWNPAARLAAGAADWFLNRAGLARFLSGDAGCDFLMLGVGNEASVGLFDTLSPGCCVSPAVVKRMRGGCGAATSSRRRRRLAGWLRRLRVPVYLTGSIDGADAAASVADLLAAYARKSGESGASGFFYDPLLDQFDPETGLTRGRGLLRVDFHGSERRREPRGVARRYGSIVRTGALRPPVAAR